ncbi:RodZ domain-containing protein [Nocardiopsis sp. JB363]|uniref:RodZ domain-containing protein n=1 Tax=Nocardiopsis sp. JB363 TaxID=1434837 RepID=UPI000B34C279|nr:RodZ domain-containing protein [Nocardiopsis sp. JB363]
MAIVGAVLLLVTLVALGGYFLYRSLPGTGTGVSANASEAAAEPVASDDMGALYIRVVGESSDVFVRVPGGDVLLDQELQQGNSVHYPDNAQGLEVTIGDPSAVEVYVNGVEQDVSDRDPDHGFTLNP